MHAFPAILPFRVSEEAGQDIHVEVALALEIAVKAAVREACSNHNLADRNAFKSVAIEQSAGAINDFLFNFGAMTGGIRHLAPFGTREYGRQTARHQAKYYFEHILALWFDAVPAGGRGN